MDSALSRIMNISLGKEQAGRCPDSQGIQPRTDDLGETGEEMNARSRELVAADESTVICKPFLCAIVVKGSECD